MLKCRKIPTNTTQSNLIKFKNNFDFDYNELEKKETRTKLLRES